MKKQIGLTHVCRWVDGKGYCRTTVEEAAKEHAETVSAGSGMFICELCGQNVTFTKSGTGVNARIRHFRHSSAAKTKECEDRQARLQTVANMPLQSLGQHTLPVRIQVSAESMSFSIGFPAPPEDWNIYCRTICIENGIPGETYRYSWNDRMEASGMTYLSVGHTPAAAYRVSYAEASTKLKDFWPEQIEGINPEGTFFEINAHDESLGKMLHRQRNVQTDKQYYFLKKEQINPPTDIVLKKVYNKAQNGWYLYRIRDIHFSENSAKFFMKYGLFLTEKASAFFPIWPVMQISPHIFSCLRKKSSFPYLYFFMQGDRMWLRLYPRGPGIIQSPYGDGQLVKIPAKERAQLVSLGISGALGFSYIIQRQIQRKKPQISVSVLNHSQQPLIPDAIEQGENKEIYNELPKRNCLWITGAYDGKIIHRSHGRLREIRFLRSGEEPVRLGDIHFGDDIEIWQGLDRVRYLHFERPVVSTEKLSETMVLQRLASCHGPMMPVPHGLGVLANQMKEYPKIKYWLREMIRKKQMPCDAYRVLTAYFYRMK